MKNRILKALITKEIYYNFVLSPQGLIFSFLLAGISNWLFFQDFFLIGQASLDPLFNLMPFLFLFFLPAVTMNLFSDERRLRTWEILLTLPTSEVEVVLAKYFSSLLFAILSIFLTIFAPIITISLLGKPDWGILFSGVAGLVLLAASFIATGIFFSSLTNNSIVSFVSNITFLLINLFLSQEVILSRLPSFLSEIIPYLSPNFHFEFLAKGNIPFNSLVFYLSWITLFLWLTIVSLKSRDY